MNPGGAIEETSKHVGSFISSMKEQPLSLALVFMNVALLIFFYYILAAVSSQRHREIDLIYADKKQMQDLLSKCVIPKSGEFRLQSDESAIVELPPIQPLPKE